MPIFGSILSALRIASRVALTSVVGWTQKTVAILLTGTSGIKDLYVVSYQPRMARRTSGIPAVRLTQHRATGGTSDVKAHGMVIAVTVFSLLGASVVVSTTTAGRAR